MLNDKELNSLLQSVSDKLNTSPEQLRGNLEKGNLDSVLNKMNSNQVKKIQKILDDPKQSEKIMNSPQAKAIIKKLMG